MSKEQIKAMAVENLATFLWRNTNMNNVDLIFGVAEALVNAGYRKQTGRFLVKENGDIVPIVQSEGEREEYQLPHIICCSECDWGTGVEDKRQFHYCPNCGAKMKGGAE